jgi:hypothetical protein
LRIFNRARHEFDFKKYVMKIVGGIAASSTKLAIEIESSTGGDDHSLMFCSARTCGVDIGSDQHG